MKIELTISEVTKAIAIYGIVHMVVWASIGITRKLLVKTERERGILNHYIKRALGLGHYPRSHMECKDGRCVFII